MFYDVIHKLLSWRKLSQWCELNINLVRQNFWIRTGRQRVKKVLKKCFICNYIQRHPLNPTEVAALPSVRVSCEHAFENVNVDFVGPLYYKVSNNEMKKCYILLFTCAVSRATHLELTTDVGTDSVILALWRFIRRRGKPNHIIRDNFKSFKASTLKRFLAHQGIKWSFILERSPWWGGFYERLVAIVKNSLKKGVLFNQTGQKIIINMQFLLHIHRKNLFFLPTPIEVAFNAANSPGFYFSAIHFSKII